MLVITTQIRPCAEHEARLRRLARQQEGRCLVNRWRREDMLVV